MNVHWALGSCILLCCVSVTGADEVPVATAPISIRIQKAGELIQVPMPDLMHGIAKDVTLDITNDSAEHFRGLSPVSSCSCISLKGQTIPDLEPHQPVSQKVVITPPEKTLAHSVKFYGTSSGADVGEKKFKFDLVFMAKVVPLVRLEPVAQVLSPEDRVAGKQISIDVIPAGKNIQLDTQVFICKLNSVERPTLVPLWQLSIAKVFKKSEASNEHSSSDIFSNCNVVADFFNSSYARDQSFTILTCTAGVSLTVRVPKMPCHRILHG